MKRDGRRSLALHTLSHMAGDPARVRILAEIADHAGLLITERGRAGGWKLARPPIEFTLADVVKDTEQSLIKRLGLTTIAEGSGASG
ncbi:MAG: Rrf2 family transcriptional regulator [Paracoccaceae bacterium]|nr:Rrf2 family transcriptional regulator [Paracoccaceae bacterium]